MAAALDNEGMIVDDDDGSQHSEALGSHDGFTDADAKEAFEQELIAFKNAVDPKLAVLAYLFSQGFTVTVQPGTPDRDELTRLLDVCDKLIRDRARMVKLQVAIDDSQDELEAYRKTVPVSKSQLRSAMTMKFNKTIAAYNIMEVRRDVDARAAQWDVKLKMCEQALNDLQAPILLESTTLDATLDAEKTPDTSHGGDEATASYTPPKDGTATDRHHKMSELDRAETRIPLTKGKDATADEFGDKSPPDASRTPLHGGGSLFEPFRPEVTTSSTHSTRAPSSPLAFTAEGKGIATVKDSGADFSLYGSNPFYLNSSVKLPLPLEIAYDSMTKTPVISQTQLKPLDPPTFTGNFIQWPRFRDDFIRLVHAPGRYLTDAERLQCLKQALKGDALVIASWYNASHSDAVYHKVTAALEEEYYRPFQARKVLHHEFLELKPKSNNSAALRNFAEATITYMNLLREYNIDLNRDCIAIEKWLEKIPGQTRLEMCRDLDLTADLALEDAVRSLKRVIIWHTSILSPNCGLGQSSAKSGGTPLAIAAGPSEVHVRDGCFGEVSQRSRVVALCASDLISAPVITELKEDGHTGGFFGTPKYQSGKPSPICCLCGSTGKHWASWCPVYDTVPKRFDRVRELGFCFKCLRKGHSAGDKSCKATFDVCRFCRGNHHRALCTEYKYIPTNQRKRHKKYRHNRQQPERSKGGTPSSQP
ncbi:Zinc knuckle family protein, partial [Aphelenchoides avenae]